MFYLPPHLLQIKQAKNNKTMELIYPFDTKDFHEAWELWKLYKKQQFKFQYKSPITEQAALKSLSLLAKTPEEAVAIIHQSMGNGWKGLFELKTKPVNGKANAADYLVSAAAAGVDPFKR